VPISQLCVNAQYCISARITNVFAIISTLLITAAANFGATLVVPAGGDLQAAINTAAAGDTIVLEAGATYRGPFTLTPKTGESFITIQSSRVSEITGRVSPLRKDLLATLRSNSVAEPVIRTTPGAHHYNLVGLEISTFSDSDFIYDLVRLGDSSQTDLSIVPHHLILDRLWIHGFETQELQRGISLNSAETSIINSYISDIHAVGIDTQAICGWNGPGPYHILNNYLEGAGENIMFGGADPQIPNLVPSDIEIRANHLLKPLTWRVDDPAYLGYHWTIKNLLELKNARRVTIDGNIFQNNWLDAQSGMPVVFTARNQDGNAPWSVVEYVLFTNNTVTNTQGGVTILKTDQESKGAVTSHISISNNLFDRIGPFNAFILLNNPCDVQITHNTIFKGGSIATLDAEPGAVKGFGLVIQDNLFSEGGYGVFGSNIGEGTPALEGFYSSYVFAKNNVAGRESYIYPIGNSFLVTPQVGFVDYAGENYRLTSSSVFKNAATDGKDTGVDIDALLASQNSITSGATAPPTPTLFVRQHYLDFLNREPDASGLSFWVNEFTQCAGDSQCLEVKRVNVSAAFFLSIEFQQTGYLVERIYKSAYGDADALSALNTYPNTHPVKVPIIKFNEFLADTQQIAKNIVVGVGDWPLQLENKKVAFTQEFVTRTRFVAAYPVTMTPADFVDTLFQRTGVTPTAMQRTSIISEFGDAEMSADTAARARVLRLVADNEVLKQQETNKAFVLMQYFGYLRRDPNAAPDTDHTGYDFWVTKLNAFNGNFVQAEMVKSFILSLEYRARFGP